MKYEDYRKLGHGRLTAFAMSCDPFVWFVASMIIGGVIGLIIGS